MVGWKFVATLKTNDKFRASSSLIGSIVATRQTGQKLGALTRHLDGVPKEPKGYLKTQMILRVANKPVIIHPSRMLNHLHHKIPVQWLSLTKHVYEELPLHSFNEYGLQTDLTSNDYLVQSHYERTHTQGSS